MSSISFVWKRNCSYKIINQYDTGFEIYRLNDVTLDPQSDDFDANYHKIDYVVDGLNKAFFSNVLAKLSSQLAEKDR